MLATTPELSRRMEAAAAEYLLQRCSGPGNPLGTQVLKRGDTFATKVRNAQNGLMNSVHGLDDPALLADVLAFYGATEQACWVTVPPYLPTSVTDALAAAGFRVESYSAAMVAEPVPDVPVGSADVHEIGRDELDAFLDTMNLGFDTNPEMLADLRRNQSFWCDMPNWHLFLARVDGVPAGAAVLSIHDDLGYLAAGSVLPAFRGRGLHGALIAARLQRARARQCRIVCGNAAWGSQSQRNQQRAGLAIAYVKSIWANQGLRKVPSTT